MMARWAGNIPLKSVHVVAGRDVAVTPGLILAVGNSTWIRPAGEMLRPKLQLVGSSS
jgi:hypothetical protein